MAKRKHSTALFEVITKPQSYTRPRPRSTQAEGLLGIAGQWWKRHFQAGPSVPSTPLVLSTQTKPVASRLPERKSVEASEDMLSHESYLKTYESPADSRDDRAMRFVDHNDDDARDGAMQTVAVAMDPEQRKISVHMSYTAALVGGVGLAMVVGLAIIAGQRITRSNVPLLAQTTTEHVRQGPIHPEVMDPARRTLANSEIATPQTGRSNTGTGIPKQTAESRVNALSTMPHDGKRYLGLNYVIIQSYHSAEEKMAIEAAAFLNKEGVNCTVETGVKGYQAITVVGLQSFDKISTPAFKSYIARILQVSGKLTANSRSYKAFSPVPKKWEGS